MEDELLVVARKPNEFEGKLRESEPQSSRWLIRLNTRLVKLARMDKILRGAMEQSVSVSDGFVKWLGGKLVN